MTELNHSQRAEIERLLTQRQAELDNSIAGLRADMTEQAGDAGAQVLDSVDVGDARMMSELDIAHLARNDRELLELKASRQRLQEDRYGDCEVCGKPIAFERLKAVPTARLCVRDEEAAEKAARS